MSATSDEANNVVASTPGIGYRLQQARELKKLSIADTASQLRFTRATVVHLEQEEWDKLHSRIYARGYLLSYVKFLGLPSDDMLSAFNAQYGDAERPNSLLVSKTLPVEKPFPWLSSLLVLIVLIIGALIYQYWPQQSLTSPELSGTETINDSAESSLQTAPEAQRLDDDIDIQPNPQNAQDTRDVNKLNELPATPLISETMPADIDSLEQQDLSEPLPATTEINAAEATPVETMTPLTNGEAQLTLVVTEASWVEVKDNGG
ncbi:MAG: helix-turn-helix domain-containing protein, partial [Methylophaga sp.]|nr:helix-turn-helix domain-containing protein [Methylophaga sp.]